MILADSSIDDELPLFPISLNGKKDGKDTNMPKTRASVEQLAPSIPSKAARTSTGFRRSQRSGIAWTKLSGRPALGEVMPSRVWAEPLQR